MPKATLSELAKIDYDYLLALETAGHVTRMLAVQSFLIEWDSFYADQQLKETISSEKQGTMTYQEAIANRMNDYLARKEGS
jgi:hypothetical protein